MTGRSDRPVRPPAPGAPAAVARPNAETPNAEHRTPNLAAGVANVLVPMLAVLALAGAVALPRRGPELAPARKATVVRVGHFANLTHAQPLAGRVRGDFARALEGTAVEFRVFNAGPALVEALFAGEIDLAYLGPGPAINAHVRSGGEELRVIAGAAANGVAVVAREGVTGLDGKRVATPQYGNTQDVAARFALGDGPHVVNAENSDILNLLRRGDVDAAWVPEPWASRLVAEAGGHILFEEKDRWPGARFATTLVVARRAFLEANPGLVGRFLQAHDDVTAWLAAHPEEGAAAVNEALRALTGKPLPAPVLRDAWSRVALTIDPLRDTVVEQARRARAIGFLKTEPDLSRLFVEVER